MNLIASFIRAFASSMIGSPVVDYAFTHKGAYDLIDIWTGYQVNYYTFGPFTFAAVLELPDFSNLD